MVPDEEVSYRAIQSRDARFDGVFYTAVHTTGIYCRPSCPARTPQRRQVSFYPSAAAAQSAGFRACKRCLPDATPGSPQWDVCADVAGRAMRLINDGLVEREGVEGLAQRLGYSSRQLHRVLVDQLGAGPLALARNRRAQTARVLLQSTDLRMSDVAFAAGFASVRQFNDTMREVYATSPTQLRGRRGHVASTGAVRIRLAVREPFARTEWLSFFRERALVGLEYVDSTSYERGVRLPRGTGVIRLDLDAPAGFVHGSLTLTDPRDLAAAIERARRILDADCDPTAIDRALSEDHRLAPGVRQRPGLRIPGHLDPAEMACRAILGQQVTVAAARTLATRILDDHGEQLFVEGTHRVTRLFPDAATLATIDPHELRMPTARKRAHHALLHAIADARVVLDRSQERQEVRASLLALPGIGPWTADYLLLRLLGDPDVMMPTDIGVRDGARALGIADIDAAATAWRPWRSYALMHLWAAAAAGRHTSNSKGN